jgi:hypothetical protein
VIIPEPSVIPGQRSSLIVHYHGTHDGRKAGVATFVAEVFGDLATLVTNTGKPPYCDRGDKNNLTQDCTAIQEGRPTKWEPFRTFDDRSGGSSPAYTVCLDERGRLVGIGRHGVVALAVYVVRNLDRPGARRFRTTRISVGRMCNVQNLRNPRVWRFCTLSGGAWAFDANRYLVMICGRNRDDRPVVRPGSAGRPCRGRRSGGNPGRRSGTSGGCGRCPSGARSWRGNRGRGRDR